MLLLRQLFVIRSQSYFMSREGSKYVAELRVFHFGVGYFHRFRPLVEAALK